MKKEFITQEGWETINLVKEYGLFGFYQLEMGNLIFEMNEYNENINKITKFLIDNPNFVMGFENDGNNYFCYVCEKEYILG